MTEPIYIDPEGDYVYGPEDFAEEDDFRTDTGPDPRITPPRPIK